MAAETTLIGTHLGPYRVIKRLGEGGMGRVYLATSPSGRAVAIKVLLAELLADQGFRRRFRAEIDAVRAVSGAFTAAVVDADPDGTPPWLATAYIAGPSLHKAITELGPMADEDLVLLAAGVAEAVAAIHHANIVHRDLTPMNVLLADDGPHVIDFGISRIVDGRGQVPPSSRILGVPGYMAPERIRGQPCTPAGDVFSLGAVLAFAAQGHSPFGDGPDVLLLDRTMREPPRLDGVPPRLRGPIQACLDKDPRQRPASAELPGVFGGTAATTWAPALAERVRNDERTLTANLPTTRFTRRRLLVGGAGLVAAVAGGIALVEWRPGAAASNQAASPIALAWTADLERPGMTIAARGDTTVICADRTGAVSFDLASGKRLWTGSDPSGVADGSDGTRVYSVPTDGRLYAIDARTGRKLWVSAAADGPTFQFATQTIVVVSKGALLRGIGATTGTTRWTYSASGDLTGVYGAVATGQVVAGAVTVGGGATARFTYTVLDLESGKVHWQKDLQDLHAPATGSTFYAIDAEENLLALRASTGEQIWSKQTALPSQAASSLAYTNSLSLTRGTLYCYPGTEGNASGSGILAAFDPNDGNTLWTVYPSNDLGGYTTMNGTVCYLDGTMTAVDARTGKALWNAGAGLGTLQLAGAAGGLFASAALDNGASQGGLYGWDAGTGQQVWHYPVTSGSGDWSFRAWLNGLLCARSGRLYAFRTA